MKKISLILICIIVVIVTTRLTRSELYSDENKFQSYDVQNGKIITQILWFKWYEEEYSDSYYVFTNKGVLRIHSGGNSSDDEDFSDYLEEHTGMYCTLTVRDQTFGHWIVTSFENCRDNPYSIEKLSSSDSDVPSSTYINYNIPSTTNTEYNNSDVPN